MGPRMNVFSNTSGLQLFIQKLISIGFVESGCWKDGKDSVHYLNRSVDKTIFEITTDTDDLETSSIMHKVVIKYRDSSKVLSFPEIEKIVTSTYIAPSMFF